MAFLFVPAPFVRGRRSSHRKVRQLKTLGDEEMKKHQVDVAAGIAWGVGQLIGEATILVGGLEQWRIYQ
jgi:MinD superfamily P-loop ATPase